VGRGHKPEKEGGSTVSVSQKSDKWELAEGTVYQTKKNGSLLERKGNPGEEKKTQGLDEGGKLKETR